MRTGDIDMPLVSVVMATYNEAPEIIETAIVSILEQTYANLEVIVADDSTNKDTIDTVDRLSADTRLNIIRQAKRMGKSHARNVALEAAKGRYIAIMDGDDVSLPERIEKEVTFLEEHTEVYMVGGQLIITDSKGNAVSSRRYPCSSRMLRWYSAFRSPLAQPAVLMRRELIDAGFRYDETLDLCEDLDFVLRVSSSYKVANLEDTVLLYRLSNDFVEKRTNDRELAVMAMVRRNNCSWKHALHSGLSLMTAELALHMPTGFLKGFYKRENNKGE